MKILFITKFVPIPKENGGKILTYNMLQMLCKISEVDYVSFYETDKELNNLSKIKQICSSVQVFYKQISVRRNKLLNYLYFFSSLISDKPYFIQKFYSAQLEKYINNLDLNKYDLILIDGLNLTQYFKKCNNKMILQEHNVEFEILLRHYRYENNVFKKIIYYKDYKKLRQYELDMIQKIKNVIYLTERDKKTIEKNIDFHQNSFVIPVGIDNREFSPLKNTQIKFEKKVYSNGSLKSVPNFEGIRWFDKEVLPIIKEKYKNFKLYHIGDYEQSQRNQLSDSIVLLGYVENINDYMNSNIIHVVPLRIGGGIRVKILTSIASGIPVVATNMAAEGINVIDGKNIFLADTPKEFAEKVIELLNDDSLRMEFIKGEKQIMSEYYSLSVIENQIKNMISSLLS